MLFAEREARETQAALEIIIDQEYVKPSRLTSLYQESCEIVAILTTIAKRAKENIALGKFDTATPAERKHPQK